MRILHLTDEYGFTGGIQSYLFNLKLELESAGLEVRIMSPPSAGTRWRGLVSGWFSPGYYRQVDRLLDRYRPDVVHAHSLSLRLSPSPLLAARNQRIPAVMTVHDFHYICPRKWMIAGNQAPCSKGFGTRCLISNCPGNKDGWRYTPYHGLRWLKIALHRRLLPKLVRTFICPSEVLARWMARSLATRNIRCISNFVVAPAAPPRQVPNPKRLLFIGRLSKEKGVDCLLRALPRVLASNPDLSLTLLGDGPERARLKRMSSLLGLHSSVHFKGEIPRNEIHRYYAQGVVAVLPSQWMENCPLTALEAMSFGTPIVASDIGGLPEIVIDGWTGLLYERGNHHDLADKIAWLVGHPTLAAEMGRNAYTSFQEKFSPRIHRDRILSLYETVLKNPG